MKIVFLTMTSIHTIEAHGIYPDLLRLFRDKGHSVTVVSPRERRTGEKTKITLADGITILGVKTLNLTKTGRIEKGVGQLLVEHQFKRAIKKYLPNAEFDLILYSTPPITFPRVIVYLKRQSPQAKTYLLLKDIFPQNAIDIGMMRRKGVGGILYRFFRRKEKKLYSLSDIIGCMSPANVSYLLSHNPDISPQKVEVAPNSIELRVHSNSDRVAIRHKYGLPSDLPVFIYGGNLGKPQGIDFLIQCLMVLSSRNDCHFLVVGSGTEYPKLKSWVSDTKPLSVTVLDRIPKEDYDELVRACDVGLIFLDHRFTIPNYPSRLLPYLENKMPIIAATDPNSDIGSIAEENGYGFWCESNDVLAFITCVNRMLKSDIQSMGNKGFCFLKNNYLVEHTYSQIMKHIGNYV